MDRTLDYGSRDRGSTPFGATTEQRTHRRKLRKFATAEPNVEGLNSRYTTEAASQTDRGCRFSYEVGLVQRQMVRKNRIAAKLIQ